VFPGFQPVPRNIVKTIVEKLGEVDVFFADRVSRGAITLANLCRDRGALVVFEPSGAVDPTLFSEMLALSHVVKYSNERRKKIVSLISDATELSCVVIETLGDEGLRYQIVEGQLDQAGWTTLEPVPTNEVRDTAGAGDWCTAGFLHAIGQRGSNGFWESTRDAIERSLMTGQHVAAWSCAFKGARGGMYVSDGCIAFPDALFEGIERDGLGSAGRLEPKSTFCTLLDLCSACPPIRASNNSAVRDLTRVPAEAVLTTTPRASR
jgi:fructokinase